MNKILAYFECLLTQTTPLDVILFPLTFALIYLGLLILPIVILPVYIGVFRSNRERDRETAVYPITQHFYRIIIMFYGFVILLVISALLANIFRKQLDSKLPIIDRLRNFCGLFILNVIQTHQVLLALLALQRFLLYFFPQLEPRITFGMKTTRIMIYSIHFIIFLPILSLIFTNQFMTNVEEDKPKQEFIMNILSVIFNSILISSVFLYIPIYISIFHLRHLPSVEEHKPQNYILYQTLLAFLLKTVQLFIIVFIPFSSIESYATNFISFQTDFYLTPMLIQLPYLFCNRRNVKSMKQWLSLKYIWSRIRNRNLDNRVGDTYMQSTTI